MKSICLTLVFLFVSSFCQFGTAQNSIQGEFIESSSPLANGNVVTTRSEPGRKVQTTITIASLPSTSSLALSRQPNQPAPNATNRADAAGSQSNEANTGQARSVLNTTSNSTINSGNSAGSATTNSGSATNRYPYPANYLPNARVGLAHNSYGSNRMGVGQVASQASTAPSARTAGLFNNPFRLGAANNGQVNATRVQYPNNCNCAPVQGSGLGLTQAPNFVALPNAQYNNQVNYQNGGLVGGGVQPVMSQPPQARQLQYQVPGQGQGNFGGQIGVPNYNANQNWTRSPWLAGAPGAYQPLFRMFNMPQGSFLGQGIIGQPEAYVNGQPVINFFRYLFPF